MSSSAAWARPPRPGPSGRPPGDSVSGAPPVWPALRRPGAAADAGLDEATYGALVARHGNETPSVLALAAGRPELLEPLVAGLPHLRVEAVWAARQEMAMTVDDVLSRRTRATLRRAEAAADGGTRHRRPSGPRMGSRPPRRTARSRRLRRRGPSGPGPGRAHPRAAPSGGAGRRDPRGGARRALFVRSFPS